MPQRKSDLVVGERFGTNLRRVRKREDLSQERLAKGAGLHRTEIGLLEKGKRVCRIDTLIRLSGAMAVPPAELLDGIFWVPAPESEGSFSFGSRSVATKPRPAIDEQSHAREQVRNPPEKSVQSQKRHQPKEGEGRETTS